MIVAQLGSPQRKQAPDFSQHLEPCIEFDTVALAVVKRNGFNPLVFVECLGQAGGGVLTARKKNQCCGVHAPNGRGSPD